MPHCLMTIWFTQKFWLIRVLKIRNLYCLANFRYHLRCFILRNKVWNHFVTRLYKKNTLIGSSDVGEINYLNPLILAHLKDTPNLFSFYFVSFLYYCTFFFFRKWTWTEMATFQWMNSWRFVSRTKVIANPYQYLSM